MDELIIRLAREGGIDISALQRASERTTAQKKDFRKRLIKQIPQERDYRSIDVLLTGSFARGEVTNGSDCDFLVTSLDTVGHRVMPAMIRHVEHVMKEMGLRILVPKAFLAISRQLLT